MQTIEEEKPADQPKTSNIIVNPDHVEKALIDLTECKNNFMKEKNEMISTLTGFRQAS